MFKYSIHNFILTLFPSKTKLKTSKISDYLLQHSDKFKNMDGTKK